MNIAKYAPTWLIKAYMFTNTFMYDAKRVYAYCFGYFQNDETVKYNLLMVLHALEKGLTMPNGKKSFGMDKIPQLLTLINKIKNPKNSTYELKYTYSIVEEYLEYHKRTKFVLPQDIQNCANEIKAYITKVIGEFDRFQGQLVFNKDAIYNQYSSFTDFANKRHSVRNYLETPIPKSVFEEVARVALTAPTSCNRQPCKMHVITDKKKIEEVLNIQGGCRGFGHLASAAIIVTSDLHAFFDVQERSQCYLNAGFYGMNILYALQERGIGSCVLNWSNTKKKDNALRSAVSGINASENICFLISCGYPSSEFMVALSQRRDYEDTIVFEQ